MPAGRPPIISNADEMQGKIDRYFAECEAQEKPKTIAGLALALGMCTEALRLYGERDEFFVTVKRAKQQVEAEVEARLFGANATGSIFWLKNNAGWKDKTEQALTGADGGPIEIKGIDVAFIKPGKD